MAYTTLAKVKGYLKIPSGETSDDALLTDFVAQAQSVIESMTERKFEASSDTTRKFDAVRYQDYVDITQVAYNRYYDYYDQRVLWFNRYDCCQITTVTNGDNTVVDSSKYVTLPINAVANGNPFFAIRLKMNSSVVWTWDDSPDAAISVTGRWAYSITAPTDIAYATMVLAAEMYRKKDNSIDANRTIVTRDGIISKVSFPEDVMAIIDQYRRLVI
jgi:hypothetical protein